MDDARLSRYPHLSWMRFFLTVPPGNRRVTLQMHGRTCGVSLVMKGRRAARQITHGQELSWTEKSGMVSCVPADGQRHTYPMTSDSGCDLFVVLIPEGHLKTAATQEGVLATTDWPPLLGRHDAAIGACMARLAEAQTSGDAVGGSADDVARRLVLRLAELNGGGKPDWHDDASPFDRRTLFNLLEYVDGDLRTPPALSDVALLAGVSPSHFAKKFRQSTGLSLCRFINRRRILRSLETLKTDDSLASIALDLGFSSQSHFTRIFSGLTGMTPANYQKQARRVVG